MLSLLLEQLFETFYLNNILLFIIFTFVFPLLNWYMSLICHFPLSDMMTKNQEGKSFKKKTETNEYKIWIIY